MTDIYSFSLDFKKNFVAWLIFGYPTCRPSTLERAHISSDLH